MVRNGDVARPGAPVPRTTPCSNACGSERDSRRSRTIYLNGRVTSLQSWRGVPALPAEIPSPGKPHQREDGAEPSRRARRKALRVPVRQCALDSRAPAACTHSYRRVLLYHISSRTMLSRALPSTVSVCAIRSCTTAANAGASLSAKASQFRGAHQLSPYLVVGRRFPSGVWTVESSRALLDASVSRGERSGGGSGFWSPQGRRPWHRGGDDRKGSVHDPLSLLRRRKRLHCLLRPF